MKGLSLFGKRVVTYLLLAISLGSHIQPAAAAMVSTADLLTTERQASTRDTLGAALQRDEVREILTAYGITPADAAQRVAQLSDAEIAQLDARIQDLPAGSSDILGLLLVLFIVFVITDALGATDIFPFVHPIDKK